MDKDYTLLMKHDFRKDAVRVTEPEIEEWKKIILKRLKKEDCTYSHHRSGDAMVIGRKNGEGQIEIFIVRGYLYEVYDTPVQNNAQ